VRSLIVGRPRRIISDRCARIVVYHCSGYLAPEPLWVFIHPTIIVLVVSRHTVHHSPHKCRDGFSTDRTTDRPTHRLTDCTLDQIKTYRRYPPPYDVFRTSPSILWPSWSSFGTRGRTRDPYRQPITILLLLSLPSDCHHRDRPSCR